MRRWLRHLSLRSLVVGARVLLLFVGRRLRGVGPRLTILGVHGTSLACLVFLGLIFVVGMGLFEIVLQQGDRQLEMVDLLVELLRLLCHNGLRLVE